ncbi:MAG: 6-phosphofructokinase [Pirellulaceae bacterium]|nr:6-phosphofructokinase [Planctomycetales bacterium]
MKRIAILTAGGDTPALNATIHGAATRANARRIELIGLVDGFRSLFDPHVPHVRLNPLFSTIPELDPTYGGTILGASRRYVSADEGPALDEACERLSQLKIDGLICIGGDGTLNGMQPLCDRIPTVLAPKTIDNDLGLNYPNENDKWMRVPDAKETDGFRYCQNESAHVAEPRQFQLDQMVNYVTPGYATAVFVSAGGVQRLRTTAESHRRIGIIEVMGRHSGFIALGSAYGQPDIVLIPEAPLNVQRLVERVKEIYAMQRNVVIVCGEGIVDERGNCLGDTERTTDPAGNVKLSGAAEQLRSLLIDGIGDDFFRRIVPDQTAKSAIFTRKVGHTQRGGRPVQFDRFHAAQLGGKALDMLLEGQNDAVATLQWNEEDGFYVDSYPSLSFHDRWGQIHPRAVHPEFYDERRMHIARTGIEYMLPIFSTAIGPDDVEYIRQTLFDSGNLFRQYHSVCTDMAKRIQQLPRSTR